MRLPIPAQPFLCRCLMTSDVMRCNAPLKVVARLLPRLGKLTSSTIEVTRSFCLHPSDAQFDDGVFWIDHSFRLLYSTHSTRMPRLTRPANSTHLMIRNSF